MRQFPCLALIITGCVLPDDWDGDGYSPFDGDCNDLDPSIHPNAEDIEADGRDQDCDGVDTIQRVAGQNHTCVLAHGAIECSGDNTHGQLDVPSSVDRVWVEMAAGSYHTCALDSDMNVDCWGDDAFGQSTPPFAGPFAAIDAGPWSSVGHLERDGSTLCWGACLTGQAP